MDTGDRVGVRVGTEETPLGYWGGTGDRGFRVGTGDDIWGQGGV